MTLREMTRVAVCLTTYRRPEGLRRLLEGLNKLTFDKSEVPDIEVIIIDNDSVGSARRYCEGIRLDLRWPLRYSIESRPGVSYARNKAITCVERNAKFIAFVDDDEVPDPCWLDELLYTQRLYDADVVSGPVIPYFDRPVPTWIVRGKFFERPRYLTGHPIAGDMARTGNVLMGAEIVKEMQEPFGERFALTGGEDTHFFMRISAMGRKIVWADDALVYELVPQSRANAKWLMKRAYSLGNRLALCERELEPSIVGRITRVAKAGVRMAQGFLTVPLSPILGGRHVLFKALQRICRGAGILAGLYGVGYKAYSR